MAENQSRVNTNSYPTYETASGYMTDAIRSQYIDTAIDSLLLPAIAHRLAPVVSLDASERHDLFDCHYLILRSSI